MEYSNPQFILFCLALMLATLGFALYRINRAAKQGEQLPESSASWAILSAFVICGLSFMQVALDGYSKISEKHASTSRDSVHKITDVVELGKKE